MIPLASGEEMRAADRRAIDTMGLAGVVLMENAGRGATDRIEQVFGRMRGRRVAVVCGKGNNGGDGFVVARHLATRGAVVSVWLVAQAADVRGAAAANLAALGEVGIVAAEIVEVAALEPLRCALSEAELVVDALLGTGLGGPASGLVSAVIEVINAARRPVCALDLPSGLSADGVELGGPLVRATLTVTFGLRKQGLVLGPHATAAGRVEVADLGVPAAWLARGVAIWMTEAADVRRALPPRPAAAHKGDYGHLLVIGGSVGKTGAAVLACLGALRAGTGLVTGAIPASAQPILAAGLPEAMTEPLAETAAGSLSSSALGRIAALAERMDAVAIGPGVGLDADTQATVRELVGTLVRPMVVDADALTALVGHLDLVARAPGPRLLTPHPGEAARLLGTSTREVQADRRGSARRLAAATGGVVALKGALTLVAEAGGVVVVNPTGNPGMATGGTGDVLTGVAGGLLAQGVAPVAALWAACYLHGMAGDLAAAERGQAGLLAGDLADALPRAIRAVHQGDAVAAW